MIYFKRSRLAESLVSNGLNHWKPQQNGGHLILDHWKTDFQNVQYYNVLGIQAPTVAHF